MRTDEKLLAIAQKLTKNKKDESDRVTGIKKKFSDKNKVKKLTTAERLDQIEEILGITDKGS